jgi:hypothetical protein
MSRLTASCVILCISGLTNTSDGAAPLARISQSSDAPTTGARYFGHWSSGSRDATETLTERELATIRETVLATCSNPAGTPTILPRPEPRRLRTNTSLPLRPPFASKVLTTPGDSPRDDRDRGTTEGPLTAMTHVVRGRTGALDSRSWASAATVDSCDAALYGG